MKQYYQAKQWLCLLFVLLSTAVQAQAQTGTVSGRVTDEQNAGVPGATVLVEGTTLGTAANVDGTYLIQNVPAGLHTVAISFVGYTTLRKSVTVVAGQTVQASASLSVNTTQLSEAVVVGYGTQRRQDVTGAIATVDTRQFVKGQVTSPEQLIQGKIAGVSITSNSGQPGVGSTIRIRGGSSLNASNDPLIVIDGVPLTNDNVSGAPNALSLINPNDIESYSVLKDASATAIYGSRAANGVILITTKKGLAGDKLHLNFSSQFSISERAKKLKVLTGDEYRALIKGQGYRTAVGDTITGFPARRDTLLGSANTDWQSEIYRTALTFDNNLSLSGSAGKVPYRVSYGNLNQQGIIRTSELQRNTLAVGITPVLLGDRLRIDVNLKGSVAKNRFTDGAVVYNALAFNPTLPVRSNDPRFAPYGGYTENVQASPTTLGNYQYEINAPANPVSLLNSRDDRSTVYRSIGNVQLDLKIPGVEGLRANYNVGFDFQRGLGTTVLDPNSRAGVVLVDSNRTKGATSRYSQNRNSWLNEVYLNYAHDFEKWGRVDALVGYSYQNFYAFNPNNRAVSLAGYVFPTTAVTPYSSTENALQSVYGRLNYTLKNRYLLTATLRRDESSRFAKDIRAGYFPAIGLGWRLKEEGFLREVGFISELKLRAGYGITGQQSINSDYGYLPRYLAGSGQVAYQFGNAFVNTLRPQSYVADRKWENTTTYNAGLDYGFGTDSRVTGTLDVYYKRSSDLLFFGPLAAGSALGNEDFYNVGKFDSKGIELAINTAVLRNENLSWNLNFNATYNKTEVVNTLRGGQDGTGAPQQAGAAGFNGVQYYAPGYPLYTYWVYKQKLDDQGRPFSTSGNTNAELLKEFEDLNNDGKIDSNDRYYAKQAAPKFILGLTSNLTAGHAYLNFTLRSYLGNYNYNNVSAALNTYGNLFASNGNYFSNTTSLLGNQVNFISGQPFSDYYVQRANFVRCENITLGYNFTKLGGSDSRTLGLSFSVQNAFVLTPYKGIDPEVVNGIDNNAYPRARTYTLGLNLGF
jgi:iron complex outermembrane receptor protein